MHLNWQEAFLRLKEGNKHFAAHKAYSGLHNRQHKAAICNSQHPYAVILSCSDSRLAPEIVFNTALGDLFVVRNSAHTLDSNSIASIEFAIDSLKASLIVILGHENCDALNAIRNNYSPSIHFNKLIKNINIKDVDSLNDIIKDHSIKTACQLVRQSNLLKSYIDHNELRIIPAYYSLQTGKVFFLPLCQ